MIMNEQARKKARRAELEYVLLGEWMKSSQQQYSFDAWLRDEVEYNHCHLRQEAKKLIALYEEGM